MIPYPFPHIQINGREVGIQQVINGTAIVESDFERKTFGFISDWLKGRDAFVQNTSGSTGAPKPVTITRGQMIASATMSIEALDLKKGDTALLCISPDFIGGKMMLVRSLLAGMRIVATTPTSDPLKSLPENLRIDFAAMVPLQIHDTLQSTSAGFLNKIKTIIIGGAGVDREIEKKIQGFSCTFFSTYGMTETASHIALRQLNGSRASEYYQSLPPIGISTDERGCLVIHWDQLPDKLITNDIVEIVSFNTFRWIGRWDNVINSGGIKVIPEKVEQQIAVIFEKLKIANRYFVGGVPDVKLGHKVTLFVEGELEEPVRQQVLNRIAELIPKVEAPKQLIQIKLFLLTENGKTNRNTTIKSYMAYM